MTIFEKLYDYQRNALLKLIPITHNLLALDMGLGKTITSLAMIRARLDGNQVDKVLILCQSIKINDWVNEMGTYFADCNIIPVTGSKSQKIAALESGYNETKKQIVVMSYRSALSYTGELGRLFANNYDGNLEFDGKRMMLVVDESQVMKSHTSQIGEFGKMLGNVCEFTTLLSGDPISTGYIDLYNQLAILKMSMSFNMFKQAFCNYEVRGGMGKSWPVLVGYKNVDTLLQVLHERSFFMKTEDAIVLPKQNFFDVEIELDNKKEVQTFYKTRIYKEHAAEHSSAVNMGMRQFASGFYKNYLNLSNHKLDAVESIVTSTNKNIIIFYNFDGELEMLKQKLKALKIKTLEVNGKQDDYEKSRVNGPERFVILVQYQAGSKGLNWQNIHYTIYFSPTWMAENWKQSIKRTHRVGQTMPCFYYKLVTRGMGEDRMWEAMAKSENFTDDMFSYELSTLFNK